MAASPPVTDCRKRPRASHLSLCRDSSDGVYPSCNKRRGTEIIQVSPCSSSSSVQPACVSSSEMPRGRASSSPRRHASSAPVSRSASDITDTADSTTGSTLLFSLPHECSQTEQQLLCCASSEEEEEAESCCGENDTSELDITCFLHHEVWEDAGSEGGNAFGFNPETIFLGTSTDCSDDAAFADCSAENGNWFLNDLECEGHGFLNEVLDQEWMAVAVANLDRINDTLDADMCVLHLLDSDHADKGY